MLRSAIIFFLVNYCAFLFSQDLAYTRNFATVRKNVPVQIVNNHAGYFHVLRYNKLAHDFTVERRQKPSGEILAFTPLMLDSVNAGWFNYEKLTYLFFESGHSAFFVFEKVLNNKRSIYLKVVDTLGKAGRFTELAFLEKDKTVRDINFEFKITDHDKLLITGTQYYINNTVKKVVLLYDPAKKEKIWMRKLPLENEYTGYSQSFITNAHNDLFYIVAKARVVSYKRKFVQNVQYLLPVFFYDSLVVASFLSGAGNINRAALAINNLSALKSIALHADDKTVAAMAHFVKQNNAGEEEPFFLSQGFSNDLGTTVFSEITPVSDDTKEKLTFYDGTDYNSPAEKDHALLETIAAGGVNYYLSERREENYYKEMLLWKINLRTGLVMSQEIIPRKIFYFDDRTRFKNIGTTAQMVYNDNFYSFLLEDRDNLKKGARDFKFHKFSRQKYLWGANLVAYIVRPGGKFEKKIIFKNADFDFVPLIYRATQPDFILYLNNTRVEKFAILKLDGL